MFNDELAQRIIQISRLGYYSPPWILVVSAAACDHVKLSTNPDTNIYQSRGLFVLWGRSTVIRPSWDC